MVVQTVMAGLNKSILELFKKKAFKLIAVYLKSNESNKTV